LEIRDRVKEFRRIRGRDLVPSARNWRVHPTAQQQALRAVFAEIGFAGAVLVRENGRGKYETIDGHLRAETAPDMEMPALVLDLTDEEADKLLLTHDPIGAMATADAGKLDALLASFKTESPALAKMLATLAKEAPRPEPEVVQDEVPIDQAARLQKKWGTKPGQLWRIGRHWLWCGDCRTHLPPDISATFVLTDPPYNVGKEYGAGTNDAQSSAKYIEWTREWFDVAQNMTQTCVVLTTGIINMPMWLAEIGQTHRVIAWIKENQLSRNYIGATSGFNCWEPVLVYGKSKKCVPRDVFDIPISVQPDVGNHPCPKSLKAWSWLITNFSDPGDSVADLFCGSGTTLVACAQLGRIGYGCEIDPGYVAVTLERLQALGLKPYRALTQGISDTRDMH
jgi:DNA modification methylase